MANVLFLVLMVLLAGQSAGQVPKKTEIVNVNGIELYYEVYGEGEPLILLHGWTQSSQFWIEYIKEYAKSYEVYALDLRGHGRTTPLTKDFSIKKAANDILAFMDHLSLNKVKAMGLSFGGIALLQLASLNPNRIESMILIAASHNYSGSDNQEIENKFNFDNLPVQFIEQLREIHHHGDQQIRALFDPELNYEIRLNDEDLKLINAKALIINGDQDEIMGINAAVLLYKYLPSSNLWIVPNTGHIPITETNKQLFLTTTIEFLRSVEK
ncbi:MAG: alpha/beta hydrolase [Bacteroidota bacterium]